MSFIVGANFLNFIKKIKIIVKYTVNTVLWNITTIQDHFYYNI